MEELNHAYIREEDNNPNGVASKGNNISKMIEIIDKELSDYFSFVNVKFSFFLYRWFILLFAQDFELDDVLKLWDFFFTKHNK